MKLQVIKNFPDYSISESGRVWSFKRGKEFELRRFPDKGGYFRVGLHQDKKFVLKQVHRLVAEAFIPNSKNKPQVNHKNGIKTCNEVWNLERVTLKENMKHAYKTGLIKVKGSNNPNSKLTEFEVRIIRRLCKNSDMLHREIGAIFNISRAVITKIKNYRLWKEI